MPVLMPVLMPAPALGPIQSITLTDSMDLRILKREIFKVRQW